MCATAWYLAVGVAEGLVVPLWDSTGQQGGADKREDAGDAQYVRAQAAFVTLPLDLRAGSPEE